MNRKIKGVCFFFLLVVSLPCSAQYKWAVGLKANDNYGGANFKVFFNELYAMDVTLHKDNSGGKGLALLVKKHFGVKKVKELHWFFGGGAQVGMWHDSFAEIKFRGGVVGSIGAEYVVLNLPIAFALE